jgi:hypothetical protein
VLYFWSKPSFRLTARALPSQVTETALPAGEGAEFRYRYRGMRLLIEAGGRLFLVPATWTAQGRTVIVPYDEHVRLQVVP